MQQAEEILAETNEQAWQEGGSATGGVDLVMSQAVVAVLRELTVTPDTTHIGYWPWGTWGQAMPFPAQVSLGQLGAGSPVAGSLGTTPMPGGSPSVGC